MRFRRCAWLGLLLAGAAHGAGAPEPPPEAVVAALPFAASREPNRVMVDLAADGARPFVMMLDTGASDSVITPRLARELGVRVRALKADRYRRSTRLGRDVQFWIDTRSSDTASFAGWEYGLLGAEFLDDYVVEIDFPGRTVRFLDPKRYEVPEQVDAPDEHVVSLVRVDTRIAAPLRVNGKDVLVMIDTGDPATARLSGKNAGAAGIDVAALPSFGETDTTVGPMKLSLYEEPALAFGGFELGPAALLVAPKGWYNIAGPTDSALGYDVLASFVIRIDYARKRLWLQRVRTEPVRLYGADYGLAKQTGVFMNTEPNGHRVWAVTPGSPAAKLGVQVGDYIVSSQGNVAPPPDEVLRAILAGKELQIARKQGELWVDHVLPEEPEPAPEP